MLKLGSTLLAVALMGAATSAHAEPQPDGDSGSVDVAKVVYDGTGFVEQPVDDTDDVVADDVEPVAKSEAPGMTEAELVICASRLPIFPVDAEARVGYAALAGARTDKNGLGAFTGVTLTAGASLWFDAGKCKRAQELALDVTATPVIDSLTGGASATMAATLTYGAAPTLDPQRGIIGTIPTSWELSYQGDLALRPSLLDRADVARDVFDRFVVGGGTRMFRIESADSCAANDQRPACKNVKGPSTPESFSLDLGTFDGSINVTDQAARRVELEASMSFLRIALRGAAAPTLDLLRVDTSDSYVDGAEASVVTLWPIRLETTNEATGTRYVLGYGYSQFSVADADGQVVYESSDHAIGGAGFATAAGPRGVGLGWTRTAYVTMAAEPVLEDRVVAEAWQTVMGMPLRTRAFAARMKRLAPSAGVAKTEWTAGAELVGSRNIGGVNVEGAVQAGRSYYAVLDGEAPRAGFGASAQLTLRKSGSHTFKR